LELLETLTKLNIAFIEFERAVTGAHSKATMTREVVYRLKRLSEGLKALICERWRLTKEVTAF
jgi:hypothetical protein